MTTERTETVIVGGGQAGLAVGYHLSMRGRPFVILEANQRVGDSWRQRWDSLRLFTPARYDGLPGRRYPGSPWAFPARDEYADYLEAYAQALDPPPRTATTVRRVSRDADAFAVDTSRGMLVADNVVVAGGFDRLPRTPDFAVDLDPSITQVHSADYRNPGQLPAGDVLVVGAGNSGADIALELARDHRVVLAGRHPGQVPWRIDRAVFRPLDLLVFFAFSHILTMRTPLGRSIRPEVMAHSGPLIRVKSRDLAAAGVQRVARIGGTSDGLPVTEDDHVLDVTTVIWCTGFQPDYSWIDLPVADGCGHALHDRGVSTTQPGLYFIGLLFQYALASSMIHGVSRDAEHVADHITRQAPAAALPNRSSRV